MWDDFEEFITGGRLGTSTPNIPWIDNTEWNSLNVRNSLLDFLNYSRNDFVSGATPAIKFVVSHSNLLLLRAYWLIYNEYYRDQNLTPDLFEFDDKTWRLSKKSSIDYNPNNRGVGLLASIFELKSGSLAYADLVAAANQFNSIFGFPASESLNEANLAFFYPPFRAWKKDLFTSAQPWAQRGAPVMIPVMGVNTPISLSSTMSGHYYNLTADMKDTGVEFRSTDDHVENNLLPVVGLDGESAAVSIEDLRMANALQRWLEHNAVGGARYKEQTMVHFGTNIPDYRLYRPEFVGGSVFNIVSSRVAQTSETGETPLGTLGGEGFGQGSMKQCVYFAREHGFLLTISSITQDAVYSQGADPFNLKLDKLDHYFPEFENLGEQKIKNAEIYIQGNAQDLKEFGYGPRWYEYKDRNNEVHGEFRHRMAYWVPQRIFSSVPGLNADFVSINPFKEQSLNNIFAVMNDPAPFQILQYNSIRAIRPMSKYSRFNF